MYRYKKADDSDAWRGARCAWREARAISQAFFSRRGNDISKEVYWRDG